MAMLASPRILCVSRTSFVSSSVLAPSKASHWGSTLNAIWCGYTEATAGSPASTVVRLPAQLLDGAGARAGHRLIGRHGDVGEPGGVVQRLQRRDELDGRAVRVGDDAAMAGDGLRVHLGHDERHVGVHPKRARLVDDHAAAATASGAKRRRASTRRPRRAPGRSPRARRRSAPAPRAPRRRRPPAGRRSGPTRTPPPRRPGSRARPAPRARSARRRRWRRPPRPRSMRWSGH